MWKQKIRNEMEEIIIKIKECENKVKPEDIKNKRVILYGAGIDGIKVLTESGKYQVDVIAFFDIRANLIKNIKGIPVVKPDFNIVTENEKADIPVILTVKPFNLRNEAIIKTLFRKVTNRLLAR